MKVGRSVHEFAINKGEKPKVLIVPLESWFWSNARALPYLLNFGYVEGLKANGVDCCMIPSQLMEEKSVSELSQTSWLRHIEQICEGMQFDQVWFEMEHSFHDEVFLDWIAARVPIRVGFVYENFEPSAGEVAQNPKGTERRKTNIKRYLPYATHIVVSNEQEVGKVQAITSKPVIWFPGGIVARFICDTHPPITNPYAVILGSIYDKHQGWLDHPTLKDLLVCPNSSPEVDARYPELFDQLQAVTQKSLESSDDINHNYLSQYLSMLQPIREQCTSLFLSGLQSGCAVVNLPQYARFYTSRVFEGMAAGRPVIAAEIPDCPRVKTLFENENEILLFSPEDPQQLAHHIRRIQRDPEFASRLALNAQHRLRSCYGSEVVVNQILHWLNTGQVPVFEKYESSSVCTQQITQGTVKHIDTNQNEDTGPKKQERNYRLALQQTKTCTQTLSETFLRWVREVCSIDVFIETGSFRGETAETACKVFGEVHTIELSDEFYQRAGQRLQPYANCHIYKGDSPSVLEEYLPQISGNILFWLDGHYSGGSTAKANGNTPILGELAAIAKSGLTSPFVLIDDIRIFQKTSDQFTLESSLSGYPTLQEVWNVIDNFAPNCQLAIIGDIAFFYPARAGIVRTPALEGCTLSRLFDGRNLSIERVLAGENAIARAGAEELQAIQELSQAFHSDESYGLGGHYRLWSGLALMTQGKFPQATEQFQKAIKLGLSHWRVLWYLAQATHGAGDRADAVSALRGVIADAPEFQAAQDLLTELLPKESTQVTPMANEVKTIDCHRPFSGHLEEIRRAAKITMGEPLRIHLGCGQNHLDGYINIDFPVSEHDVMTPQADIFIDILELEFPEETVDEIRSHHMFEHFSRATALALLIRWHQWLKVGGSIRIETPDFLACAKTFLSQDSWRVKMGLVRHLAGDQSSHWGYHLDHWFPERFAHTFETLGFEQVESQEWSWDHGPFLGNVDVVGVKTKQLALSELLLRADELLWESTVADSEKPTYEIWKKQLRDILSRSELPVCTQRTLSVCQMQENASRFSTNERSEDPLAGANSTDPNPISIAQKDGSRHSNTFVLPTGIFQQTDGIPLSEIHGFNQNDRDEWVRRKAATVPAGARVLDIGAGTCPYRRLFSHCDYKSHDFKKYDGVKLGNTTEYGHIDYVSDIGSIPVPDDSFDAILCSEVLEHIPEPILALQEMGRILKPDGRLFLTAPLGSGLHQLPYHFYGGYTPEWYKHFGQKFGFEVVEIVPNGGYFKLLAQECARVSWTFPQHQHLHGEHASTVYQLFNEWLPRYLYWLDTQCFIDQFTVGYHVEMVLTQCANTNESEKNSLLQHVQCQHRNPSAFVRLAHRELNEANPSRAKRYLIAALAIAPDHAEAKNLLETVRTL